MTNLDDPKNLFCEKSSFYAEPVAGIFNRSQKNRVVTRDGETKRTITAKGH